MASLALGRRIMRFVGLIVVGYVLALVLIRVFESRFVFFPNYPDRLGGDWTPRGLPIQDIWFISTDGTKLHAWWIENQRASYTFLAFHGNAGNIADRSNIYRFLSETPANVFAVEYRGYGKSDGKPSEAGMYLDAQAAFDYLVRSKGISPAKIISFGQSLGTAVAADLAANREVGGVVLEAPFPSAARVARSKLWFFPGLSLLLLNQFDTERQLPKIRAPILIVHCRQDPVVPFELGEAVYNVKATAPMSFLPVDSFCHEEAALLAAPIYRARLRNFFGVREKTGSQQ